VYDLDHRPDQQENNIDGPVTNKNLVPSPLPIFYVAPMIESFDQTSMIGTACIERGPAEFFN